MKGPGGLRGGLAVSISDSRHEDITHCDDVCGYSDGRTFGRDRISGCRIGRDIDMDVIFLFSGVSGQCQHICRTTLWSGESTGNHRVAWQGIYLALGSYLLILLINQFTGPAFALMKPSPEVQRLAGIYTEIRLYGGITVFISFGLGGFL